MFSVGSAWKDAFRPGYVSFNSLKITEATEQVLLNSVHTMNQYYTENPITHGIF